MEAAGLIQAHGLPTTRGQQRHFEVLAAGREALADWCGQECDLRPIRDALLVRMRAAAVLETTGETVDVCAEMRRHLVLHKEVLARYVAIEQQDFPVGVPRTTAEELQLGVLRAGIAYEESWLAWCQQTLTDLAQG